MIVTVFYVVVNIISFSFFSSCPFFLSFPKLMNTLSEVGPPSDSDEYNVVNGLTQAVEELCKLTDLQQKKMVDDEEQVVENKGRVICITHGKKYVRVLSNFFSGSCILTVDCSLRNEH